MLLASDVNIPIMSGATIVTHLRAIHPNTQVPFYLWAPTNTLQRYAFPRK